jgi:hypothetical protein
MNEGAFGRSQHQNKTATRLYAATMRPNGYLLIVAPTGSVNKHLVCCSSFFRDTGHHDTSSPRAACHHRPHGRAIRKLFLACADRAHGDGAGRAA